MNRKLSKILGIALTIALLTSLVTVAAPAAALTQPQVSVPVGQTTIGATATYTITFTAGTALQAGNQTVIVFPAGTNLGAAGAYAGGVVNIQALTGIGGGNFNGAPGAAVVSGTFPNAQTLTLTLGAGQSYGAGSLVGITIPGVVNPATPGTYTLTVATQLASLIPVEAAVTSNSYTITSPTIVPLPGVVLAYNSAGVLMSQSNSINTGVGAAGVGGRIEVGPGTYDEDVVMNVAQQTLIATGGPGTVIISNADSDAVEFGTLTVSAAGSLLLGGCTVDGFTITPSVVNGPATPVTITGSYVTVQNCDITAGTTSAITGGALGINTVSNCTITATGVGLVPNTGIVASDQMTIDGCTFTIGALGTAITSAAGVPGPPPAPTAITNNTITGSSGVGVVVTAGTVTLTSNTLSTLSRALNITGGTVTATKNTIDGCGSAVPPPPVDAITVAAGAFLNMSENTVSGTTATGAYAIRNAGNLVAYFNNITGNTLNVFATGANVTTVDHNWWGAATGPALGTVTAGTITVPVLGNATGASAYATAATALVGVTTTGVDVACLNSGVPAAAGIIGVSKLAANPVSSAPLIVGTGSVLQYYDIYVANPGTVNTIQLKFYGAVTPYTKIYYSGGLTGAWIQASNSGVNVAGGYAYATITAATSPTITELTGTPFAMVEDKTVAPPALTGAAATPAIGAYEISVDPTFTWGAVAGAIRYEIALSEDPTFTIPEWSYNVDNTFYKAEESLRYETTYYWRVRGVLGEPYQEMGTWITPATPWATGIFTTEAEAVEAEAPTVVEVDPVKPEVNVDIPPTKITVEPATAAIPNYMLWIIVVVGAVLIIALIVLIVRTRRVV